MSETILKVQHLGKSFGNNEILKDIDFSVKPKDVTCIIGPSGSGKSTLLRSINLLETPTSGEIWVDGTCITEKGQNIRAIRQKVGMVFQHFNLFAHMTVLKNMIYAPVKTKKLTKEQATEKAMQLLARVGLAEKANVYPVTLSGGQKQRVAIARALMRHPKLLLADEPAASLDPVTGHQILELLKEIQKTEGVTVLMNSHNLELSLEFSDRIIGLTDGSVAFDGTPDQLDEAMIRLIYEKEGANP